MLYGENWVLRVLWYYAGCATGDTKPRHRRESKKSVILSFWNYTLRRELGPPSALALRWLCDGGEKATAPQGEGPWEAEYTYFQLILGVILEASSGQPGLQQQKALPGT